MKTRNGLIVIVLLFSFQPVGAINEEWGTKVLVQPDGTSFVVREFVDEFGHYLLSEEGLVVQDPVSKYYYYARYDSEGNAAPSSFLVGRDNALAGVARLAKDNGNTLREIASQSQGRVEVFLGRAFSGVATAASGPSTLELIVILAEFSDVKHQNSDDWPITDSSLLGFNDCSFTEAGCVGKEYSEYTVKHFEDMLFGNNYRESPDGETAHGSMRQYWLDMSKADFLLEGEVANDRDENGIPVWVELDKKKSDFHSGTAYSFTKAVLDAATASPHGIDISTSAARKICIIYAGNMYVEGGLNPQYIPNIYIMSEKYSPLHPTPRNREMNSANFSHIGVHCHEFGHVLGFGDKYEQEKLNKGRGYRKWGLMADGGNKGVEIRGDNPAPLSPHHRAALGWIDLRPVEGLKENEELSYSSVRGSYQDDVYKIVSPTDPDDFFLIENRQTGTGWNQVLALGNGGGLLIWHIGEKSGLRNDYIDLIEADGSAVDNRADYYGDLFPGSTKKTALTDFTTPNSRKWGPDDPLTTEHDPANPANPGDNSDVLVFNIHGSGSSMRADLSPFWVGEISEDVTEDLTWRRTVTVGGDVTIPSGVTLTIEKDTQIQFLANEDATSDGSKLIVQGTLEASAGNITFRSVNTTTASRSDWYGIVVEDGGTADLSDATVRDGSHCAQAPGTGTLTIENTVFLNCGLAPPGPPMSLRRVLGDGEVTLKWGAADANGSAITDYYVRYRLSSDRNWTGPSSLPASAIEHTVEELNNGDTYVFEVWAENGQGTGAADRITATPQVTIDGPKKVSFAEIPEGIQEWNSFVATYEKSGSFTWSLEGDDKAQFELKGQGADSRELHFDKDKDPPDFENPQDTAGEDNTYNTYNVTIKVEERVDLARASGQAGDTAFSKAVKVTVTNVEEAGTVTISSPSDPPRVDEELTAMLTDPDGVRTETESWTWWRQEADTYPYPQKIATTLTYTPEKDDIGYLLQAKAEYADGEGSDKEKTSAWTKAVVGRPAAPGTLKATAGDGQVVLEWITPADHGLPLTGYKYRQSTDGGNTWSPDWTAIDPSDAATTMYPVSDLTNDIEYTFEVRAVNEAGDGEAASTRATPHFVINESETTAVSFAEIVEGPQAWDPLVATYTTNKAEDTPVRWSLDGTDTSAFTITETDGAGKLSFKADAAPDYETQPTYAVTVQAHVREGDPTASTAAVAVTVEVDNVDEAGTVALSGTLPPQVGEAVSATLTDPDGALTDLAWQWQRQAPGTTPTHNPCTPYAHELKEDSYDPAYYHDSSSNTMCWKPSSTIRILSARRG